MAAAGRTGRCDGGRVQPRAAILTRRELLPIAIGGERKRRQSIRAPGPMLCTAAARSVRARGCAQQLKVACELRRSAAAETPRPPMLSLCTAAAAWLSRTDRAGRQAHARCPRRPRPVGLHTSRIASKCRIAPLRAAIWSALPACAAPGAQSAGARSYKSRQRAPGVGCP